MRKYKLKHTLVVPLPMSINKMYMYNRTTHQKIYKKEARDFLEMQKWVIHAEMTKRSLTRVTDYKHFDLHFYLSNPRADSHNYKKLLFDALEHGGLVSNDKFIMDRTQKVDVDKENPRVIITWAD